MFIYMIENEFLAKLAGFWFFYRWHPAIAIRYLPFVDEINKLPQNSSVLEVGSAGLGITPYLKRVVTGADIKFEKPFSPLLKQIVADATSLPFKNSSFDIVLSVDMLEHLSADARIKAIGEIVRVARVKVLIGVPSGQLSQAQDIKLDHQYQKTKHKTFSFFQEQIRLGLPREEEIKNALIESALKYNKKVELKVFGNENLKLHDFLMKGWMSDNLLVNIFYRKMLLFAIPILRLFNQEPCYRKMFIVEILS